MNLSRIGPRMKLACTWELGHQHGYGTPDREVLLALGCLHRDAWIYQPGRLALAWDAVQDYLMHLPGYWQAVFDPPYRRPAPPAHSTDRCALRFNKESHLAFWITSLVAEHELLSTHMIHPSPTIAVDMYLNGTYYGSPGTQGIPSDTLPAWKILQQNLERLERFYVVPA